MNKFRLIILLSIAIVVLTSFLTWRWLILPKIAITTVPITIKGVDNPNPLDKLIRRYLYQVGVSTKLLEQLAQPPLIVSINNIAVQKCEVDQGSFRRFSHWRASQIKPPPAHPAQPENWQYKSHTQDHKFLGKLKVPAGGLSFFDSYAFCTAVGGRLPESYEFQAIASNADFDLYPWGNDFDNSAWQYRDPSLNIAKDCAAQPNHSTKDGINGLGTNVSEWTTTNGIPTLMGGNAYQKPYELFSINLLKRTAPADYRSDYTGFRCIFDVNTINRQNNEAFAITPWQQKLAVVTIKDRQVKIGVDPAAKLPALFNSLEKINIKSLAGFALTDAIANLTISKYEITVAQYQYFLLDPLVMLGFFDHPKQAPTIRHKPKNWSLQKLNKHKPVTNITWWSAWSFAKWLGAKLPSAEQWQKIASANTSKFPYGNYYAFLRSIDRNRLASQWQPLVVTESNDASKHGVIGLTGNVAEWTTSTVIRGNSFNVVIKGGSFYMPEQAGTIDFASEAPPNYSSDDLGFRVVFAKKSMKN